MTKTYEENIQLVVEAYETIIDEKLFKNCRLKRNTYSTKPHWTYPYPDI